MTQPSRNHRNPIFDLSLWSLLLSNGITIYIAMREQWNLSPLLWIYWSQSVTIGLFHFLRMLRPKTVSMSTLKQSYVQSTSVNNTGPFMAFFFLVHYGIFHFVYMIFLLTNSFIGFMGNPISAGDIKFIAFSSLLFFLHHGFSYFYNRPGAGKTEDIDALFFYPYARIIPMHLTIILGALIRAATLPFFLVLKTAADVIMHIYEHRLEENA